MSKDVKNLAHWTQFPLQPIQFFRANIKVLDFMQMCCIKYICRYKMKNGKEDLLKARNFIDMMIEDWDRDHTEPQAPSDLDLLQAAASKAAAPASQAPRLGRY